MELVILGLDGLEPTLVREWEDDLPTLSRLREEGSFGRVRSSDPPLTAPAWPWMFTGKQGGKHGCFGFTKRASGSYERDPVNYSDIHAESLWEALDEAGVACGVANVPLTYPPSDLEHGYVLAGWPVPNRVNVSSSTEVLDILETELGETYRVNPFPMGPELDQMSGEEKLEAISDGLWHHQRAFATLARETDIDVFFGVLMATDVAGHYLGWEPDLLHDLYVEADRAVEELLDEYPDRTDLILMSDHGHTAKSTWNLHVNEWLRDNGFLSVTEPSGPQTGTIMRQIGVTRENALRAKRALGIGDVRELLPQSVFNLAKKVIPPADERKAGFDPDQIDWSNTVAYSSDQNIVYLNTKKHHPKGIVEPEDVDDRHREIQSGLRTVEHPDPDRDDRLITECLRQDEVYSGPFEDEAPAIVLIADEMHCAAQVSLNDGELFSDTQWSEHRQFGTLITVGDSFTQSDEPDDQSILDIFPLVLSLLDVPLPENVDGEIPTDRLAIDIEPTFRESRDEHAVARDYSEEESDAVREQLEGLGYLE